jgi:probable rRNA maturation factor
VTGLLLEKRFPRSGPVLIRNQRRAVRIDVRVLRRITRTLLIDLLDREHFDLGIHLVGIPRITELNEAWLKHKGRTDVITFDYHDPAAPGTLAGEIFICVDEAIAQARRFRTAWQTELVRYIVHGILHLCGFDDQKSDDRKRMKREEDRLLKALGAQFNLREAAKAPVSNGAGAPTR